jgi:DNA invertase Pin-like site-specific DNA recombinase
MLCGDNKMAVIAYVRVSTEKQDTASQLHEIKAFCKSQGLTLDQVIEVEMSSRKSTKERRIDELVSRLKKGDTLIVSELSRVGRSLAEVVLLVEKLVKKGVRFVAIKQMLTLNGNIDPITRAMVGLLSIFGQLERDLISQRTKNGLAAAKARGVKLGNPNLKADNEKRSRRAQEFAESLRSTIEGYINQGMTQRQIVDEMNRVGIKTRRGYEWRLIGLQNVLKRLSLKTRQSR